MKELSLENENYETAEETKKAKIFINSSKEEKLMRGFIYRFRKTSLYINAMNIEKKDVHDIVRIASYCAGFSNIYTGNMHTTSLMAKQEKTKSYKKAIRDVEKKVSNYSLAQKQLIIELLFKGHSQERLREFTKRALIVAFKENDELFVSDKALTKHIRRLQNKNFDILMPKNEEVNDILVVEELVSSMVSMSESIVKQVLKITASKKHEYAHEENIPKKNKHIELFKRRVNKDSPFYDTIICAADDEIEEWIKMLSYLGALYAENIKNAYFVNLADIKRERDIKERIRNMRHREWDRLRIGPVQRECFLSLLFLGFSKDKLDDAKRYLFARKVLMKENFEILNKYMDAKKYAENLRDSFEITYPKLAIASVVKTIEKIEDSCEKSIRATKDIYERVRDAKPRKNRYKKDIQT